MTVGQFFISTSYTGVGQKFIQRYLAIGNLNDIKKAVWLNMFMGMLVNLSTIITGLFIYAHYRGCDPISAKLVEQGDQIVPLYVLEITKNLPGVAGMSFITSSAFSTMSASINSLAGIVYDNFISDSIVESPGKDTKSAAIMKIISAIIGVISIGLIFGLEYMGTILEMSFSIRGALDGPLLGFFLAGMFVPWIGNIGTITGASVSLLIMVWITIGAKWHAINRTIRDPHLPLSTENCTQLFNITAIENVTLTPLESNDEPLSVFRLSFFYYIFIGSMITLIIGFVVSIVMKESNLLEVEPEHIVPVMRRFLPKKEYQEVPLNENRQSHITE